MDSTSIPRMAAGCRLHPTESILLVPEGTLTLTGPTRGILTLVDGTRSVEEITQAILTEYPEADPSEVATDTLSLLQRLRQRGVVRI